MSRIEAEREDLMRDASALRTRGEFRVPGSNTTIIAGRRENGGWSIYFGQDPCYHFDADGRLRRAFVSERIYRTQGATLAVLRRVRSPDSTQLMRRDLEPAVRDSFLSEVQQRLTRLHKDLQNGTATLVQSVPEGADVAGLLTRYLDSMLNSPPELAPPIKTRRH